MIAGEIQLTGMVYVKYFQIKPENIWKTLINFDASQATSQTFYCSLPPIKDNLPFHQPTPFIINPFLLYFRERIESPLTTPLHLRTGEYYPIRNKRQPANLCQTR